MLQRFLVNVKEASYLLSISPRHIFNLVKAGVLKPVRLGSRVLFDPDHLREVAAQWKQAGRVPSRMGGESASAETAQQEAERAAEAVPEA